MKKQGLIALKRFDIYGNSMPLYNVTNWAGIRYSMVNLIIQRIIIAILDKNLKIYYISWPIREKKESIKNCVEDQTYFTFQDK